MSEEMKFNSKEVQEKLLNGLAVLTKEQIRERVQKARVTGVKKMVKNEKITCVVYRTANNRERTAMRLGKSSYWHVGAEDVQMSTRDLVRAIGQGIGDFWGI